MSDTSRRVFGHRRQAADAAARPLASQPLAPRPLAPRRRRRRLALILAAAATSLLALGCLALGGGYLYVSHLLSGIRRIPNIAALVAAHQPVMPAATRHSMTVLLTGSFLVPRTRDGNGPIDSSTAPQSTSGLIALVHLNANGRGGAVVSIPPNAVVRVPGHNRMQLWQTLSTGGPSLLIRTVERLTNVRVDHYCVLDFESATDVVGAMKELDVTVPYAVTSLGYHFHAGQNDLTPGNMLAYVRQPQVSEIGRTLLEQNLIRVMLHRVVSGEMFESPGTDMAVLTAMSKALSVDSNFSNAQLMDLSLDLGNLGSGAGVFVTAPTVNRSPTSGGVGPVFLDRKISRKLWRAIRHDSVRAFAKRYPFTVTPGAPG